MPERKRKRATPVAQRGCGKQDKKGGKKAGGVLKKGEGFSLGGGGCGKVKTCAWELGTREKHLLKSDKKTWGFFSQQDKETLSVKKKPAKGKTNTPTSGPLEKDEEHASTHTGSKKGGRKGELGGDPGLQFPKRTVKGGRGTKTLRQPPILIQGEPNREEGQKRPENSNGAREEEKGHGGSPKDEGRRDKYARKNRE